MTVEYQIGAIDRISGSIAIYWRHLRKPTHSRLFRPPSGSAMDFRNALSSCPRHSRLLLLARADVESPGAAMNQLRYSCSKIDTGLGGHIHAFDQSTIRSVCAHRRTRRLALLPSPLSIGSGDLERNASPNLPSSELPDAACRPFDSLRAGTQCRA